MLVSSEASGFGIHVNYLFNQQGESCHMVMAYVAFLCWIVATLNNRTYYVSLCVPVKTIFFYCLYIYLIPICCIGKNNNTLHFLPLFSLLKREEVKFL